MENKTIAIVAIVIILAVFGTIAAFAKTTNTKVIDSTTTKDEGAGKFFACLINPLSCR